MALLCITIQITRGYGLFGQKNKEAYQLLKRGYLKIVPIQEFEAGGMGLTKNEATD
jgi:hypothetical protein